ncbi:TlpA family protein disulfide reductase [Neptunicella sp. SCSIO 80796]|uniref:TlpA family protein disulfide reductase n=1 Tax=Neptunicella plasticusilytica TaxID=3117012 RepID=UPI003A4DC4D9
MLKKLCIIVVALSALLAGVWVANYNRSDFTTLSGEKGQWSDGQGQWLVINYFAEWCAPCLKEIPQLNQFNQQTADSDVRLIAISWDNLGQTELQQIADKYAMEFELAYQVNPDNLPFVKPAQLPATFILSPQGKVVKKLLGEQTAELLTQHIEQLKVKYPH